MESNRFDRFLPVAGLLAGLVFLAALVLLRNDPPSETDAAATFDYWQANRGQHQLIALLGAPLVAFLLIFFGPACGVAWSPGAMARVTAWSPSAAHCSEL